MSERTRPALSVDEAFARSFVINLDGAKDKLPMMEKAFSAEGLPVPRRFGAFQMKHLCHNEWWKIGGNKYYMINCNASHLACIRMAEALGWPFVFVFEDDAWPRHGARDMIARAISDVPETCGVLRFEWSAGDRKDMPAVERPWLRRSNGHWRPYGAASYLIFADAYQRYFDSYRAELKRYNQDLLFTLYDPLCAVTRYVDPMPFTQVSRSNGRWRYTWAYRDDPPTAKCTYKWSPEDGFPAVEEVLDGR